MEFLISSKSFDETNGTGKIIMEGVLPIPKGFDEPIVELFRPIRAKENILYTIVVIRKEECIICTFYPSCFEQKPGKDFFETATRLLRKIVEEYEALLGLFFEKEEGLTKFLANVENDDFVKANEDIKAFVKSVGFEMPSIKKRLKEIEKEANKKTRK